MRAGFFYSSRISLCACGRHHYPCEMIRICICMKIPPAGLSATQRVLLPLTALCWIEMIHWLVGQTKFNLTTNSLKRKRGPSHRRDYYMVAVTTSHPWPISSLLTAKNAQITKRKIFLIVNF